MVYCGYKRMFIEDLTVLAAGKKGGEGWMKDGMCELCVDMMRRYVVVKMLYVRIIKPFDHPIRMRNCALRRLGNREALKKRGRNFIML